VACAGWVREKKKMWPTGGGWLSSCGRREKKFKGRASCAVEEAENKIQGKGGRPSRVQEMKKMFSP